MIGTGWYIFAVLMGLLVAFVVTGLWKADLRSVNKAYAAGSYVKKDSFVLERQRDRFLYKKTEKEEKEKPENASQK